MEGDVGGAPGPDEMREFLGRVARLEEEMESRGAFVFGGALFGPDSAKVLAPSDGGISTTDGPFAETKEQIAGFYIINSEDLEEALAWGAKVAEATNHPIEVRPFRATGRVEV